LPLRPLRPAPLRRSAPPFRTAPSPVPGHAVL